MFWELSIEEICLILLKRSKRFVLLPITQIIRASQHFSSRVVEEIFRPPIIDVLSLSLSEGHFNNHHLQFSQFFSRHFPLVNSLFV